MGGIYFGIELSQRQFDKLMDAKRLYGEASGMEMNDNDFVIVLLGFGTRFFREQLKDKESDFYKSMKDFGSILHN